MVTEYHQVSVIGMSCAQCRDRVQRALEDVPGVIAVEIEIETGTANVEAGSGEVTMDALVAAIEDAGYAAGTMSGP